MQLCKLSSIQRQMTLLTMKSQDLSRSTKSLLKNLLLKSSKQLMQEQQILKQRREHLLLLQLKMQAKEKMERKEVHLQKRKRLKQLALKLRKKKQNVFVLNKLKQTLIDTQNLLKWEDE